MLIFSWGCVIIKSQSNPVIRVCDSDFLPTLIIWDIKLYAWHIRLLSFMDCQWTYKVRRYNPPAYAGKK